MAAAAFSYRTKGDSSDSDSDDSDKECTDWKRATRRTNDTNLEKIQISPTKKPAEVEEMDGPLIDNSKTSGKRKRNHIWCEVLQDQMMSETLNHCGLKNKPKDYGSRGEESYDYTLKYKFSKKEGDHKSSEDELSDASGSSSMKYHKNKKFKGSKYVELDDIGTAAAKKIISVLSEPKQYLIFRVVKHLGVEKALKLLKMTEEIEENGGQMIKNQQRRRTPGGVYFQLLRSEKDIEKKLFDKIFEGEFNSFEMKKKYAEERKLKKKLAKEKAALLKQLEKGVTQAVKREEATIEDESMIVEETAAEDVPLRHNDVTITTETALEDGEIDD